MVIGQISHDNVHAYQECRADQGHSGGVVGGVTTDVTSSVLQGDMTVTANLRWPSHVTKILQSDWTEDVNTHTAVSLQCLGELTRIWQK